MAKNSIAWKLNIENGKQHHFLVGTIHLGFSGMQDFIQGLESALSTCHCFYGESDLDALHELELPSCTLDVNDIFTAKQKARIAKILVRFDLSSWNMIERLHPMVSLSMVTKILIKDSGQGMDFALQALAKSHGLETRGIETVAEQAQYFHAIPEAHHWKALKSLLLNLSRYRRNLQTIIERYKAQDIHTLYQRSRRELGELRHLMINVRNPIMVERIATEIHQDTQSNFFTMGAAHLSGQYGIISLLRKKGVQVRPMKQFYVS